MLKKILKFTVFGLLGVAGIAYAIDSGIVVLAGDKQGYEDIRVDQVYTDTNKWHEVEYSRGTPVTERCIDAAFPHGSYRPCWYVKKHTMNVTSTD